MLGRRWSDSHDAPALQLPLAQARQIHASPRLSPAVGAASTSGQHRGSTGAAGAAAAAAAGSRRPGRSMPGGRSRSSPRAIARGGRPGAGPCSWLRVVRCLSPAAMGLGGRHRGIVDLSEGVTRCVTVFACYSSSSSSCGVLAAATLEGGGGGGECGPRGQPCSGRPAGGAQISAGCRAVLGAA